MSCTQNPASEELADFIYRYYPFAFQQIISMENLCYNFVNSQFVIVHRPLSEVTPMSVQREGYDSIPNLYALLDASALESAGIYKTFGQPRLGNKGRGVIIGLVDTGIDYRNPIFRNSDGSTRILGIWDQTIPGEGLPDADPLNALHYGTVYPESEINRALREPNPLSVVPSEDVIGHGTMMAATAAGGGDVISGFTGAAPESKLAVVKLKQAKQYLRDFFMVSRDADAFQENDIMLGVKYLLLVAREHHMPLVILLGLGTNTGSHGGTSPLAVYLSDLSRFGGQAIILAAGNETGRGHHYFGSIPPNDDFEDVELRVGPDERGFTMELWARESEIYTVGFISPSGEEISKIPISRTPEHRLTFLLEETVIHVAYASSDAATGSELILMRFDAPSPGLWKIRVYSSLSVLGQYHIWLPVHGFISEETFFLRPDPDTTITEPGNAPPLITTAAYNHHTGGLYIHSSRGYSRTGAVKPDLTAPGVNIEGPASRTATGTSIAAAHVAGAAAILLSWSVSGERPVFMNTPITKAILIRGADRKTNLPYPNREWGYGTLNLYQSFLAMRD